MKSNCHLLTTVIQLKYLLLPMVSLEVPYSAMTLCHNYCSVHIERLKFSCFMNDYSNYRNATFTFLISTVIVMTTCSENSTLSCSLIDKEREGGLEVNHIIATVQQDVNYNIFCLT